MDDDLVDAFEDSLEVIGDNLEVFELVGVASADTRGELSDFILPRLLAVHRGKGIMPSFIDEFIIKTY